MIASTGPCRIPQALPRLARAFPATLLLAGLGAAIAVGQPFPTTGVIEIGSGDALTSELAAAPVDGGFVVVFDGRSAPGSSNERLSLHVLAADGSVVAHQGPSAVAIQQVRATSHPEGALVGYLAAVPFLRPTLKLSLLHGDGLVSGASAQRRESTSERWSC